MEFTTNPILRWILNVRDYGLEYVSKRYYGLYGGEVSENQDTQQQGRVKTKVGIFGIGVRLPTGEMAPKELARHATPGTIYAGQDHGIYFPPEVGDSVWVSFDHGDPTYPRHHGSWWRNYDPAKTSVGSELPSEFKQTASEIAQPYPTRPFRRGIKTKFGHGLIFSDNESEPFVTLWSGRQTGPGQPAIRKQQFALSDVPGQEGITALTFYGHKIHLNDADQSITISGLSADPAGVTANSIKIEDKFGRITIKTKLQQQVTIDDTALSTTVVTPGQVGVTAAGPVAITSAAACSITAASITTASGAGGPAVETGAGSKISTFVGDITETVGGAFTQNVVGVMNLTAASLNLTAVLMNFLGIVIIGNPLTARTLANDYLIDFVLNHQHPTAVPGPPSIPTPGPISTIVTPGLPLPPITLLQYGTTTLKAT